MEFIDYQAFETAPDNNDKSGTNGEVSLPEPVSRLNISSFSLDYKPLKDNFKLPSILSNVETSLLQTKADVQDDTAMAQKLKKDTSNLYDRMSDYVDLSIQNFGTKNIKDSTPIPEATTRKTLVEPSSIDLEKSNEILAKKLSKVLNEYDTSYHHTIKLRKSLKILEKNRDKLGISEEKLISPDYIGTLARKSLRTDLETQLLKDHVTVLEDFKPIVRRIKRLAAPVQQIENIGEEILKNDKETFSQKYISDIDDCRNHLLKLEQKKKILKALQSKFTLNQLEDDLIENGPLKEEIFDIVDKLTKMKEHATYLLALPNSKAGEVLIKQTNITLDTINKKISNYLIDYMYTFESNSNMGTKHVIDPTERNLALFQKGLVYLSNDIQYYDDFLKRVTTMRSKTLLDEFLSQFGTTSELSTTISSSEDPVRYIGDVLATIHTMIANEVDFVKSLFKFTSEDMDKSSSMIINNNAQYFDGLDLKLVNDIVQYLANSCKLRIEQVIRFEENKVINFEITQLLDLYSSMFVNKGIRDDNPLVLHLIQLRDISEKKIINSLTKQLAETENTQISSPDLLPPQWLSDYLNSITELFDHVERLYGGKRFSKDDIDSDKYMFPYDTLKTVIEEPFMTSLIKQIKDSYPLAKKKEEIRIVMLTLQINCFEMINFRLQPYSLSIFSYDESCKHILENIQHTLDETVEKLQKLQISLLFERTGLNMYYNLMNMIFPIDSIQDEIDYDMYMSLVDNPLMSLENLEKNIHEKLNDYLPQALPDFQDNLLIKLTSPSIADDVCEICFRTLTEFYCIFRRILKHLYPDNKEKVEAILNFTESEFKTLAGV
ncbi:COG6 [Nakaseomyces glabratus]|nr:COG6 [Nakaseomyces glabratus]UCS25629.1 COG6 [Nakaseomyces glabratus]UCS30859.1 COG6 [Nakaseomyces glabratus]UCS36088.1 COG6 [Nakaseomyces glabratus]